MSDLYQRKGNRAQEKVGDQEEMQHDGAQGNAKVAVGGQDDKDAEARRGAGVRRRRGRAAARGVKGVAALPFRRVAQIAARSSSLPLGRGEPDRLTSRYRRTQEAY
jgi:hypothetical protein